MSSPPLPPDWENPEIAGARRFRHPLAIAWQRKSLIALGLCVALAIGLLYYSQATPIYQSTAQVLVVRKRAEPLPVAGAGAVQQVFVEDYLATHTILIRSQEIVRRAAKILEVNSPGVIPSGGDPIAFISSGLSVTREIRDGNAMPSNVLNLAFRGPRRADCALVVNAIIEAYKEFLNETYGDLNKEFVDQMKVAEKTLKVDIEERQAARDKLASIDPLALKSKDSLGGLLERIARFESRQADLLLRQKESEQTLAMVKSSLARGESRGVILKLLERSESNRQPTVDQRSPDEALQALLLQEEELRQELGKDHPQLVSLRRRIQSLRDRASEIARSGDKLDPLELHTRLLERELEQNQVMQKTVAGILEEDRKKATETARYLDSVERANEAIKPYQQLYENANARLRQLQLTPNSDIYNAKTIVEAAPGIKVAPSLVATLALALVLGAVAGIGLAYAAEWTDNGFHDPDEIRRGLGLPIVGHIPFLPASPAPDSAVDEHLCAYHAPKSPQAEAFRGLRTALYFSTQRQGHQVIQVTSPSKGDGKSTLIANLAISIAYSGKSVVLVDADFRRPAIHELFRLGRPQSGLASAILGEVDLNRVVQPGPISGLSLIPCGPQPAQPAELLTSPRFQEFLAELRQRFEFVLIDTPPLLAVTDPAVVASRVDGVILTLRPSKKCRPTAERAKEILGSVGANILGIVVNGAAGFRSGNAYGYDYGFGYSSNEDDEPAFERGENDRADRLPQPSGNGATS